MMPVYQISKSTKALISENYNTYNTRILDTKGEKLSNHKLEHILAKNCLNYGSAIEGTKKYVSKILQTKINLPIPVFPIKGIFMFPTTSLSNDDCVMLSYFQIKFYKKINEHVFVRFHDETDLSLNVSHYTFDRQFKKTAQVIAELQRPIIWQ